MPWRVAATVTVSLRRSIPASLVTEARSPTRRPAAMRISAVFSSTARPDTGAPKPRPISICDRLVGACRPGKRDEIEDQIAVDARDAGAVHLLGEGAEGRLGVVLEEDAAPGRVGGGLEHQVAAQDAVADRAVGSNHRLDLMVVPEIVERRRRDHELLDRRRHEELVGPLLGEDAIAAHDEQAAHALGRRRRRQRRRPARRCRPTDRAREPLCPSPVIEALS